MVYISGRGGPELWGLDISEKQVKLTRDKLQQKGLKARLVCSPMEEACGLPQAYFDMVYSVYGIGWTTDLELTFERIASYLKKGGSFIFSWSHPIHKCVALKDGVYGFEKSYFDESWYSVYRRGGTLSLSDRKLSTYINALSKAGFMIDTMVEESEEDLRQEGHSAFSRKAEILPVTFVIKAIKR